MNELNDQCAAENALSSSMGCFMKGTLVETEEGWTPIDELKVGDWVMSRPENGIGEAVPKRVVNTFRYEDKEVVMLKFSQFPERNGGGDPGCHSQPPVLRVRRGYQPDCRASGIR